MADDRYDEDCAQAATMLAAADAVVISAGAGLGVDSGLPDFRGRDGFWRAYPALRHAQIDFTEIANPTAFAETPTLAWGFYGHRLALYRRTVPHVGFAILRALAARLPKGGFVFTSNVDGQFQKAGFAPERVLEAHGSIHRLQCVDACSNRSWSAQDFEPRVDVEACRLLNDAPRCPDCGAMARPNILMFGDWQWVEDQAAQQHARFQRWWPTVQRAVVVELGAGKAVPTVRGFSESLHVPLIRINPDAPAIGARPGVSLAMGARDALLRIGAHVARQVPDFVLPCEAV